MLSSFSPKNTTVSSPSTNGNPPDKNTPAGLATRNPFEYFLGSFSMIKLVGKTLSVYFPIHITGIIVLKIEFGIEQTPPTIG